MRLSVELTWGCKAQLVEYYAAGFQKVSLVLILLWVVRFEFLEAFICQLLSFFQLLRRKEFL